MPVPAAVFWAPPPLSVPPPLRDMVTETPLLGLPNASVTSTVTAGENVCPTLTVAGGCCANEIALAAAAETVRVTPEPPAEVEARPPLSDTLSVAVSAFFATRMPWPAAVTLTPPVNVINSEVPSLTGAPVLSLIVGTALLGELLSPLKVSVLSPLKVVTVFWNWSTSVIVSWSLAPAVGVVLAAVIRYALAVVALTVNPLEVAPVSPLLLAVRVLLAPAVVGMIALKVATPLDAATVSVLAVNAVLALPMVTLALLPVTVLLN